MNRKLNVCFSNYVHRRAKGQCKRLNSKLNVDNGSIILLTESLRGYFQKSEDQIASTLIHIARRQIWARGPARTTSETTQPAIATQGRVVGARKEGWRLRHLLSSPVRKWLQPICRETNRLNEKFNDLLNN